jgi:hypothetical protein
MNVVLIRVHFFSSEDGGPLVVPVGSHLDGSGNRV